MSMFKIYKPAQGKVTRWSTLGGAMLLVVAGARALSMQLSTFNNPYIEFGIPALMLVLLGVFCFWMVNRAKNADFLIATEGEMKKVSWSSKKEIIGSTKVVILTMLIMAAMLFVVDLLFGMLFISAGIVASAGKG